MSAPEQSSWSVITGWTPSIPRKLQQLLIDAARYDQLADGVTGSQRRKYFRYKTKAMVQAHSKFPDWFHPPRREGGCIALYPKTGWPSRDGVRTKMHIPVAMIMTNPYYRQRYRQVMEGPSCRRPRCSDNAKPWPRRLCPRTPLSKDKRYRNRRVALTTASA